MRNSIPKVLEITAEYFNVTVSQIKSKSRKAGYVKARKYICYYLRNESNNNITFQQIGKALNQDHATVMFHVQDLEKKFILRKNEREYRKFELFVKKKMGSISNVNWVRLVDVEDMQKATFRATLKRIKDILDNNKGYVINTTYTNKVEQDLIFWYNTKRK